MVIKERKNENGYHWIEPITVTIQKLYEDESLFNKLNGCCLYYKKGKPNEMIVYCYSDQTIPFEKVRHIDGYLSKFFAYPDKPLGGLF